MGEHEPQITDLKAIKLGTNPEDYKKLIKFLNRKKAPWLVNFETDSFLLDPDTAKAVSRQIETEDVTDTYQELIQRKEGYQVLRISGQVEVASGKKIRGPERIIRDYSEGEYVMIDSFGVKHSLDFPMAMDRLCSGAFEHAPSIGKNPIIFETFEEAKQAFLN